MPDPKSDADFFHENLQEEVERLVKSATSALDKTIIDALDKAITKRVRLELDSRDAVMAARIRKIYGIED